MDAPPVLGSGQTADVLAWGPGQVLKLFRPDAAAGAAQQEHDRAQAIRDCAFPRPGAHGLVRHDGRWGIVYDRVDGESLESWTLRTGDVQQCASVLADLQSMIGRCVAAPTLPDFRDVLAGHIGQADGLTVAARSAALTALEELEDGASVCHGDLHPGNVLLSPTGPQVIDFMNVCRGPVLYDVARTVYLVQRTPVPPGVADPGALRRLKDALADAHLASIGVDRDAIAGYLAVISAARVGECPAERPDIPGAFRPHGC